MKASRRNFLVGAALGAGAAALRPMVATAQEVDGKVIPGFDQTKTDVNKGSVWTPVSDRKIKVGLVGYGVCLFGAGFGFQDHPNVEVVAVSDLNPDRCAAFAKHVKCEKTYESLEKMIEDDSIEAIFVATDAPSHARQCIEAMKRGKHVACAVPAVFGEAGLEEADELLETVKKTGRTYMLFETSAYHDAVYAAREVYKAGGFGKMIYTEGEYFHYSPKAYDSYKGWRVGLPPQWYPTHSNAYYINVTGGSFTEVSCMGHMGDFPHNQPGGNPYGNPFSSEIALFRTSEGGLARMAVCWDTYMLGEETGRNTGSKGTSWRPNPRTGVPFQSGLADVQELLKTLNLKKPAIPIAAGGHGGSHGYLTNEFIEAILQNRKPLVDVVSALNLTVSGIIAHRSALKDGETMKIPQYA